MKTSQYTHRELRASAKSGLFQIPEIGSRIYMYTCERLSHMGVPLVLGGGVIPGVAPAPVQFRRGAMTVEPTAGPRRSGSSRATERSPLMKCGPRGS